jgi:hypothetical protein
VEGFEYETKLEDGMSGPAREEVRALKELAGAVGVTAKELKKLQDANKRESGESLGLETAKHLGLAFTGAQLLARGLESVGEAAIGAAEKIGDIGLEATKFAIEAAEFRDNTILAYAAVQGTAEEGEATFKQLDRIAGQFHMPAKQAHQLARDLMLQGLDDTKLIGASIEATAALMRTGQVQGAQKLQSIIEKSLASGHFDAGKGLAGSKKGAASGRALAGLGVHLPELLQDLAKRTGQSVAQVQAQLKAGKISTEVGVAALVDAINTGIIGKTAAAKYDIRDFTTDASNFFTRMVQEINLKPLEASFKDIATVLGFVANRKDGVQGVFQTIVDWTGKAIESALLLGLDFEIAFLKVEIALIPVEKAFESIEDAIKGVIDWLGLAGQSMIEFSKTIPGVGSLVKSGEAAAPTRHQISWDEALLAPIGLGGIIEGARISTENSARDMGLDMGKQAVAGARDGADAHSPSDEMKTLGKDMSDGLGIGFSASSVTQSMRGGISGAEGSGGGHSFSFSMGDIHAPHANSQEVASLVASQVEDAFERFALELGR